MPWHFESPRRGRRDDTIIIVARASKSDFLARKLAALSVYIPRARSTARISRRLGSGDVKALSRVSFHVASMRK